ncbi:hypothetical protein [Arthrobacter pigmenti]
MLPTRQAQLRALQEVLAICANEGHQITASAFSKYVSTGKAPAPTTHNGRIPLWSEDEITAWARDGIEPVTPQGTPPAVPADAADDLPQLSPLHSVVLDQTLPQHKAMAKAEDALTERLHQLEAAMANLETERTEELQSRQITAASSNAKPGAIDRLLQHLGTARAEREQQKDEEILAEALAETTSAREAATADLEAVRSWNRGLLTWATEEQARRQAEHDAAQIAAEHARRHLRLDDTVSIEEFIRHDHRRFSWFSSDDKNLTTADILATIDAGEDPNAVLVLAGADFGYKWSHDSTDAPPTTGDWQDRPTTWRISWIKETNELYAIHLGSYRVKLIGTLPRTTFERVMHWVRPLESQQKQRNSLALAAMAYEEQREAEFPALAIPDWETM